MGLRSDNKERPQPPADGYRIMAPLVGEKYFVANKPPKNGTRVYVWGADGVRTVWDLPDVQAVAVVKELRRLGTRFATEPYRPA